MEQKISLNFGGKFMFVLGNVCLWILRTVQSWFQGGHSEVIPGDPFEQARELLYLCDGVWPAMFLQLIRTH